MSFVKKYILPWLTFFFLASACLLYAAAHWHSPESFAGDFSTWAVIGGQGHIHADGLHLVMDAHTEWMDVHIPLPKETVKRLQVHIASFQNITAIVLSTQEGQRLVDRVHKPLIDPQHKIQRFGLPPVAVEEVILRFKRTHFVHPATLSVQSFAFESPNFFDSTLFLPLAFVSCAAFLVCIALCILALLRPLVPLSPQQRLALLPLALVLGLFLCFLWLMLVHALKAGPLLFNLGLLLCLGAGLSQKTFRHSIVLLTRQMQASLLAYYLLVLGIAIVVGTRHDAPLYDISWVSIAFGKTYQAFTAHDNLFQYLNALALAYKHSFASFYHAEHMPYLFYGVEHRGILPGTLLAPWLFLLGNGGELAGGEFTLFLIAGTVLTATALFPLYALWRRYRPNISASWVFFFLSANSYVLVNYYYTWFKLLSGGLVVAGLYLLLSNNRRMSHWLLAGLCWGAASGLHAGAILSLPALGLLLWLRGMYLHGRNLHQILLAPGLLVLIFVGANLPWSLVKTLYFTNDGSLIKEHFFNGHDNPAGLRASARDFIEAEPWASQLRFRTQRLHESLRWPLVHDLVSTWPDKSLRHNFAQWLRLEYTYVAILLYPLLFLALLASILPGKNRLQRNRELYLVFGTSCCALIGNIFIYFNKIHLPDLTWHLPAATILLLQVYLFTLATGRGRVASSLTLLFSLVGYWRIIRLL